MQMLMLRDSESERSESSRANKKQEKMKVVVEMIYSGGNESQWICTSRSPWPLRASKWFSLEKGTSKKLLCEFNSTEILLVSHVVGT